MLDFAKKLLCYILIFQLSGCAQAAMQMRQEHHSKVGQRISELETECESENKRKIDALEEKILCLQQKAPEIFEAENYSDADIITALFEAQLKAIDEHREKKLSYKKLEKKIKELEDKASADLADRENQRFLKDQEADKAVAAILAVAAAGALVYSACKDGGCGGSGGNYNRNYSQSNLQGCCSWHQGVNSCVGGRVLCNDGQFSPSCGC